MLTMWNNDKEMASQLTKQLECLTRAPVFSNELTAFWYFKLQVKRGNAYIQVYRILLEPQKQSYRSHHNKARWEISFSFQNLVLPFHMMLVKLFYTSILSYSLMATISG